MRPRTTGRRRRGAPAVLAHGTQTSLLDIVDSLLNQGVLVDGEIVLGVAHVDLVYLRLSTILSAADRILARQSLSSGKRPGRAPRVRKRAAAPR